MTGRRVLAGQALVGGRRGPGRRTVPVTCLTAARKHSAMSNESSVGPADSIHNGRAHLERNHLPLWKVSALGLAYMQIGPSMAVSAGSLIAFSAHAAWLSNLISVTVLTLMSLVISAYARRFVVTGSLVSYAYEAFGRRARLFVAACMVLGYIALTATLILTVVTPQGIIQGAIAATGYYVGFDGIAALSVETKDPKRNVPHVLIATVVIIGIAITASCLAQYPMLLGHANELAAGGSPVAIVAHAIGWDWLAVVVDFLLVPATLASTVALYNVGARIIATTAADGLLPAWISRVHPRSHTPVAAVGALAVVATSLAVLIQ